MDLREHQRPLKERYRADADTARITLRATGATLDAPVACSVDIGRATYEAQAHLGVGGPGTAPCSGDLLLGALAACAQVTAQMVAAAMGLEPRRLEVSAEGDLDLRGTLGVDPDAPVGFETIRLHFDLDLPDASDEDIQRFLERTERYCVVLQTLRQPPAVAMSAG